jgi:hypothetical protein
MGALWQARNKGSSSFLKKKTKKLLVFGWRFAGDIWSASQGLAMTKVFCFFFSKKQTFLFLITLSYRQ